MTSLPSAGREPHVWYASYGSNLYADRFACYLGGGQVAGMATPCAGARDATPPTDSMVLRVPHGLFFAQSHTPRWGAGGVAFLDPLPSREGRSSVMRAYRITLGQFNDVVAQENRCVPPLPRALQVTPERLESLRRRPNQSMPLLPQGWYGELKMLGEREGEPVLTFTCPLEHRAAYQRNQAAPYVLCAPSPSYRGMLQRGLEECGLDASEADVYLTRAATQGLRLADSSRENARPRTPERSPRSTKPKPDSKPRAQDPGLRNAHPR